MIRSSQLAREWADGCGMSIDHHAFETRGKSLANSQFVALKALKKEDFPVRRSREREKRHAKGADKFRNSQKCKEPERRAKDERGRISRKLDNCTRSPWALVESLVFFSLFSRSAFFLSVPKCFVPEISFRSLLLLLLLLLLRPKNRRQKRAKSSSFRTERSKIVPTLPTKP